MNLAAVEKIANAVLYEGYVLYPYRPSAVKNQQRFNFGVLYPPAYCDLNPGSDNWQMQTECLMMGSAASVVEVKSRFLQMAQQPDAEWQEGIEREVSTVGCGLRSLEDHPLQLPFAFEAGIDFAGRRCEKIEGELVLGASRLDNGLHRLRLQVRNRARLPGTAGRDAALLRSLVSTHAVLQAAGSRFVSLTDPPEQYREAAGACQNIGTWPVLAGEEGQTDLILSAPIILYDYPQIAPESAGDLCDGTEIDEILALRILTLTDQEKREVRAGDERARRILEQTEMLPPEHFQKLHGALRGLGRPSKETQ